MADFYMLLPFARVGICNTCLCVKIKSLQNKKYSDNDFSSANFIPQSKGRTSNVTAKNESRDDLKITNIKNTPTC